MRGLIAALTASVLSVSASAETVKIYNWNDYFGETTIEDFERETGITVELSNFETNEDLERSLQAGEVYDVVFPSDSYFTRQADQGWYQRINKMLLPNYYKGMDRNVLATLYETVDPGNKFGIPYLWGTTGLVVDAEKVRAVLGADVALNSWSLVFDRNNLRKLVNSCGVAMFDSPEEVMPYYLHYQGKSHSSTDASDWRNAQAYLKPFASKITWLGDATELEVLEGRACVAMAWSGDFFESLWALEEEGVVSDAFYVIPSEGAPMWFDMMAIPANAPNPDAAHKFINFILEAENSAAITNYVAFPTPVLPAIPLVDEELRANRAIYPDVQTRRSLFVERGLPTEIAELRTALWQELRGSQYAAN